MQDEQNQLILTGGQFVVKKKKKFKKKRKIRKKIGKKFELRRKKK